jgi:hypothetical protein
MDSVLRHVPLVGRAAARNYYEAVVAEEPPVCPTVPWNSASPAWMVKPVPVHNVRGEPVQWADSGPHKE